MRLQKYLAICGIASRRKSEEIIENGRVKINGNVVNRQGYQVTDFDIVELDNKKLFPEQKVYVVLNKPPGIICTHKDRWHRKTIYDIINTGGGNIFSLGRLDIKSSGLIILTNDGDFANSITHPSNNIIKEYFVESYSPTPDILIRDFKKGVVINDIIYKAENIKRTDKKNIIRIYLKEGKKREIRNVYKKYLVKIKTLRRIGIGKMRLDVLNIKESEYKFFSLGEIKNLIL